MSELPVLTSLPSVAFSERRLLPDEPAVYFALADDGSVLYVGESGSIYTRWNKHGHHRRDKIIERGGASICWLTEPDAAKRIVIERDCIAAFDPPLNGSGSYDPSMYLNPDPDWLTPSQVAKRINVTTRRVSLLCREGRFPGADRTQDGDAGRWLIPQKAVAAFLADDTKRRGPKPKAKA